MNRVIALAAAAAVVVVSVGFYFLAWQPKEEEIAAVNEQREQVLAQQQQLRQLLAELEEVRARAPELQADIVTAESIVPHDMAIPSALRQLQLAADEAGVELPSVTIGRPAQVREGHPGLASLGVSISLDGGYYEVVDFLRRIEDPAITPRGLTWQNVSVSASDYPILTVSVTGQMFALLPPAAAPQSAPATQEDDNAAASAEEPAAEEDAQ